MLAARVRINDIRLAQFSKIATLRTPPDLSQQKLRLELLCPAGDATARSSTRTTDSKYSEVPAGRSTVAGIGRLYPRVEGFASIPGSDDRAPRECAGRACTHL
jgi:hypothetical protein